MTGQTLELGMSTTDTILDLKMKIEKEEGTYCAAIADPDRKAFGERE
tara:strand:- start:659 stop:799 length:141 start_codon:yes stop_codon:yes gene_type:complete